LGRPADAGPRFYRAARASAAQGDAARARSLLAEASDAAGAAGDNGLLALVRALRNEWDNGATQPAASQP
jgi:hypothetical protein